MLTIVSKVNDETFSLLDRTAKYYHTSIAVVLRNLAARAIESGKIDDSRTKREPLADRPLVIKFRCDRDFKDKWLKLLYVNDFSVEQYALRCIIDTTARTTNDYDEIIINF